MQTRSSARGFTLLELLLAVSILSVISAAAYQLLMASTAAIEYVKSNHTKIRAVRELQWRLRQDLTAIIRPLSVDIEMPEYSVNISQNQDITLLVDTADNTSFLHDNQYTIAYHLSQERKGEPFRSTKSLVRVLTGKFPGAPSNEDALLDDITDLGLVITDSIGDKHSHWPPPTLELTSKKDHQRSSHFIPSTVQLAIESEQLGPIVIVVGIW